MLNNDDEIAVVITKKAWSWTAKYDIEEQWKENATSYRVEYSWSGSGITKEVFIIKNSKGDEIARTDRFRMEFGKTITVKDSKSCSLLGEIERPPTGISALPHLGNNSKQRRCCTIISIWSYRNYNNPKRR